ncbi:MAG: M20/M25/M40 family metallo-hydrolase [Candidatus Hodarchaeota archaeon]
MSKVDVFIENNKERFITELFRLLRQPSISTQQIGVPKCAQLLKNEMMRVGITTTIFETAQNPIVFGEITSTLSEKTLLLYGHYDVQPSEPLELWKSPPFEPEIREDRIYARGSSDDKGQLFTAVKAIEALLKILGELPCNVKLLFEGEEEIGSPNLEPFIKEHKELLKADAHIGLDGSIHETGQPQLILGLKGMVEATIRVRTANRDLHSGRAAAVPSAPWKLVWVLNKLKGDDNRVRVEGFYDNIREPLQEELEVLTKIPVDTKDLLEFLNLHEFIDGAVDLKFLQKLLFNPTFNIQGIQSGYTLEGYKTVLPAEAFAKLDIRLVPDQDPDDILDKLATFIKNINDPDIILEENRGANLYPSRTPITDPFVNIVRNSMEAVYQASPIILPSIAGSGPDYVFTRILGLPSIWVPCAPFDSDNHAANENITIKGFITGIRTVTRIVQDFANS